MISSSLNPSQRPFNKGVMRMLNSFNYLEDFNSYNPKLEEHSILSVDEVLANRSWQILNSEKEIINHVYDEVLIPNSKITTQKEAICFC